MVTELNELDLIKLSNAVSFCMYNGDDQHTKDCQRLYKKLRMLIDAQRSEPNEESFVNLYFNFECPYLKHITTPHRTVGVRYGSLVLQFESSKLAIQAIREYKKVLGDRDVSKDKYLADAKHYADLGNYNGVSSQSLQKLRFETFYWIVGFERL